MTTVDQVLMDIAAAQRPTAKAAAFWTLQRKPPYFAHGERP
jgi:hypothetical protein